MIFLLERFLNPPLRKVEPKINKYLEKVEPNHLNPYFYISYSFFYLFCVL